MRLISVTMVREDGYGDSSNTPAFINADFLRSIYPRRGNAPGTRLTFADGGGFAVTEPVETIVAQLRQNGSDANISSPTPLPVSGRARRRRVAAPADDTSPEGVVHGESGEDDGLHE